MNQFTNLKSLILNHKKIIAVYGLGNVGGPIAAAWLRAGAKVIGVDISKKLLADIKNNTSHKKEPFVSDTFKKHITNHTFLVSSDGVSASKDSQIKIVAVPVDLANNKINLNSLIAVTKTIALGLKKGDAVIISPSVPPGTTEKIVKPILEQSGLKADDDFYLIYNPERIFEGRALMDIEVNYPAIVAGLTKKSLAFGESLLKIISKKGTLPLSSLATAEAEKLFEGVYRDVNIAVANELAIFCEHSNINYWEARKAANSQPYCHLHYPGTGVGGLCIPVYPKFIIESAKKMGQTMKMIEYARSLNDFMPKQCVNTAIHFLKENRKKLEKKPKIAILGLGFRGDVTDSRLSPTYLVTEEFLKNGYSVSIHDPFIREDEILPSHILLSNKLEEVVSNASLIFISTDHKMYSKLTKESFTKAKKPLVIFDGRNILNKNNFKNSLIYTIGMRQYIPASKI